MAEEWARIPEYARSLEQTVGLPALDEMIAALRDERGRAHAASTRASCSAAGARSPRTRPGTEPDQARILV